MLVVPMFAPMSTKPCFAGVKMNIVKEALASHGNPYSTLASSEWPDVVSLYVNHEVAVGWFQPHNAFHAQFAGGLRQ